ncbi:MAG: pyrroline-5-carboxylate reductase [Proteobacteria bacterium]|nr:pyrroline-5-carboxylate reductase [Pseudomonadota bacterium]
MPTIGFIGGGNMATSLIGGLINAGIDPADITVAEPDENRRKNISEQFSINTSADNSATLQCDTVVLAVKPQLLKTVCHQLDAEAGDKTLFISIAAGVSSTDINRWLNHDRNSDQQTSGQAAIVRCMPNTPALLQCGATGLFANGAVNEEQRGQAEQIMQAVGIAIWVDTEQQLDAVTAVSGSGPAYYFLMMEAMQKAGEELGLSSDTAQKLVLQTALGAARMAIESNDSPYELRKKVTSKGGTTEQAILSFQASGFQQIVSDALNAASERSKSLAVELGSE